VAKDEGRKSEARGGVTQLDATRCSLTQQHLWVGPSSGRASGLGGLDSTMLENTAFKATC
jgi:hypothetical protein